MKPECSAFKEKMFCILSIISLFMYISAAFFSFKNVWLNMTDTLCLPILSSICLSPNESFDFGIEWV